MKTKNLLLVAAVGSGLAFTFTARAGEHPGESVSEKSLPTAVQKTITAKAGSGKVVAVRREDDPDGKWNYEVAVQTDGKQWGFEVDPKGRLTNKHAAENNAH